MSGHHSLFPTQSVQCDRHSGLRPTLEADYSVCREITWPPQELKDRLPLNEEWTPARIHLTLNQPLPPSPHNREDDHITYSSFFKMFMVSLILQTYLKRWRDCIGLCFCVVFTSASMFQCFGQLGFVKRRFMRIFRSVVCSHSIGPRIRSQLCVFQYCFYIFYFHDILDYLCSLL